MTISLRALRLGASALEVVPASRLAASQGMTRWGSRCHCRGFADGNLDR